VAAVGVQFGNFQNEVAVRFFKAERRRFGRFYYRFPSGEAGIDVYGRVTGFFGSLYREHARPKADNVLIITHGLTMRLFLMRWYRWTVEKFENTGNPMNCGLVVMEKDVSGRLQLVHDAGIVDGGVESPDTGVEQSSPDGQWQ
jgi:broad specificity phosphatase PhoE